MNLMYFSDEKDITTVDTLLPISFSGGECFMMHVSLPPYPPSLCIN